MAFALVFVFLVVPFAELWFLLTVADAIGGWSTIGLLLVVSIVGSWLVKREGLGVWLKVQRQLEQGEMPTSSVIDGALILFAGALMLTPGFLTDIVALMLLLPPTRAAIRVLLVRRFSHRLQAGVAHQVRVQTFGFGGRGPGSGPAGRGGDGPDGVIDVDSDEIRSDRRLPPRDG